MTLAACGPTVWPTPIVIGGPWDSGLAAGSVLFDSVTDRLAWVGRSPVTDTLTTVHFRTAVVTTGSTVDVRIETVTNGRPSGTLFGTNTNITVAIANTDDNVWKTATLTAAASLNLGDEFAIVIVNSSGTPNQNFSASAVATSNFGGHYPLCLQDTGAGTWAQLNGTGNSIGAFSWVVTMGTAGVIPLPGLLPVDGSATVTAFNSGSSPDEYALRFQVPFKCRVVGAAIPMFNMAAGADFSVSLWPASSSVDGDASAQKSYDGDIAISTTKDGLNYFYWNNAVTLTPGTTYYLGVRADTANNIAVASYSAAGTGASANGIKGFPANSAEVYLATRTWTAGTAGAWTTTTTSQPIMSLLIDQLDDGAGGSGGLLFIPDLAGT